MDYNNWVQDLRSRGFNTTGLSGNEANFADYGNALSNDIKSKIAQNGQTQADKDLQAFVASLFGKKSNLKSNDLMSMCRSKGLKVSSSYQKTTYIVDEKQTGKKGQKKVITGSINIITITDPKTGGKLVIADANGNAAIEIEEVFMNEILSGVTSDIRAGDGSGSDSAYGANLEAQKQAKQAELEKLKTENAELAAQIGELEAQAKKEIEEAEAEIQRIQEELERETETIRATWIARYENDPENYTQEYIDSQIGSEISNLTATANSNISMQEAKINNNTYLGQIDKLVADASVNEAKTLAANNEFVSLGGKPEAALNSEGYAAQQNGQDALPTAQQYNQMVANLKKEYAYANESSTLTKAQMSSNALLQEVAASAETETINDKQEAKEATEKTEEEAKKKKLEEEQAT